MLHRLLLPAPIERNNNNNRGVRLWPIDKRDRFRVPESSSVGLYDHSWLIAWWIRGKWPKSKPSLVTWMYQLSAGLLFSPYRSRSRWTELSPIGWVARNLWVDREGNTFSGRILHTCACLFRALRFFFFLSNQLFSFVRPVRYCSITFNAGRSSFIFYFLFCFFLFFALEGVKAYTSARSTLSLMIFHLWRY